MQQVLQTSHMEYKNGDGTLFEKSDLVTQFHQCEATKYNDATKMIRLARHMKSSHLSTLYLFSHKTFSFLVRWQDDMRDTQQFISKASAKASSLKFP